LKKQLSESQRTLLDLLRQKVIEARNVYQSAVSLVAKELGMKDNETWVLEADGRSFETDRKVTEKTGG
jgi:hypothetical protein